MSALATATLNPKKYPTQRSFTAEAQVLYELGIGKGDMSVTGKFRFVRPSIFETQVSVDWGHQLEGRKLLDQQLTKLLLQTFKRQNLISWGYEADVTSEHEFNGQWFSAHGFCWLRPLLTTAKGQQPEPCPAVFDVRSGAATLRDVQAFATRIRNAGYRPRSGLRVLGIMGARFFEPDAFELGKKQGFILVNFHEEIGDTALEALAAVERIVTASPEKMAERPDFIDLFTKLKYHPQVKELASLAFEGFTCAIAQAQGWANAHTNLAVRFGDEKTGTWRDVDVSGQRGDHHLAIECKAISKEKHLEAKDLNKFFKQTVPSYIKHFSQQKKIISLTAEIWTTGQISQENKTHLAEIRAHASPTHTYILRPAGKIEIPTAVKSLEKLLVSIGGL